MAVTRPEDQLAVVIAEDDVDYVRVLSGSKSALISTDILAESINKRLADVETISNGAAKLIAVSDEDAVKQADANAVREFADVYAKSEVDAAITGIDEDVDALRGDVSDLAAEIDIVGASITTNQIVAASWSDLVTLAGTIDRQGAEVVADDTGTHGAASVTGYDGPLVANAGRYSWSESWSRWVRVGDAVVTAAAIRPLQAALQIGDNGAVRIVDQDGAVGLEIGPDGIVKGAGFSFFNGGSLATFTIVEDEAWAWALRSPDGEIAFGVDHNGVFYPTIGDNGGGGDWPISHVVTTVFAEPWSDPSRSLALTWVNNSAVDGIVVEYRPQGGAAWMASASQRTRAWPSDSGRHCHSAVLADLTPDTVYELRWPGAAKTESVKTCPRSDVTVAFGSDWHGNTSTLPDFATATGTLGADLVCLVGDLAGDDGQSTAPDMALWETLLSASWRTPGGALLPLVALVGNHDASDHAGTGNAVHGGDGLIGPISALMSWAYDDDQPTREADGVSTVSIGRELLIIGLNTSHTVPLAGAQFAWFEEQIARAPDYRHVIVVGHCPAFLAAADFNFEYDDQSRVLRTSYWPAMQAFADKVRFYLAGHEHILTVTARLAIAPGLDPVSGNDLKWTTDPGGVMQIGSGPMGGMRSALSAVKAGTVSTEDGSPKMIAAMGRDAGADSIQVHGSGIVTANVTGSETWHMWRCRFDPTGWSATAYNRDGLTLYEIDEGI